MRRLLSFLLLLLPLVVMSQQDTTSYIVISDIVIEGNKVTKESVILKELTFAVGDTIDISRLEEELLFCKENIQNTTLFNFVEINCLKNADSPDELTLQIKVTERWYLWPCLL